MQGEWVKGKEEKLALRRSRCGEFQTNIWRAYTGYTENLNMETLQTLAQLWIILAKLISMDSQPDTVNFMEKKFVFVVFPIKARDYRLNSLTEYYSASAVRGCRGNLYERMPWTAQCQSQSIPASPKLDENNNQSIKSSTSQRSTSYLCPNVFWKGQELVGTGDTWENTKGNTKEDRRMHKRNTRYVKKRILRKGDVVGDIPGNVAG